jgi:hypothetical protein
MRSFAVIALLAASVLSGCASPSDDAPSEDGPTFDDLGLQATSSTGVIRGVVVDDAIRPIAGAKVTLLGESPREAVTTDQGVFGFDGLPAATYFLKVHKLGYSDAQQSADVVAGVADPPIVKVQLVADASSTPYHESYVFDGFIECSGSFVVVGAAVCSIPNVLLEQNVTQDNFGVFYDLSGKPTWMQSEMVWQSTQALGSAMNLQYAWDCGETLLCEHEVSGPSPLLLTADAEAIDTINGGDYEEQLFVRAFNEGLAETSGLLGLTLQQRFTVYTHVFYGYEPPADWRFSSGQPVPQPA